MLRRLRRSTMPVIHRASRPACVALVLLGLAGCSQTGGMGQKEQIGTGIGAVLGGVAGSLFGEGSGKTVAVVVGSGMGGVIGNRIGAMLDDRDEQALQARAQRALLSQRDNAATRWSSDHSGASATIVPTNSRVETRPIRIVRDSTVAPAPRLDVISAGYVAKTAADVHVAPSEEAAVATSLRSGSPVWAVGKVPDRPWIMVARNGKSIGYVDADRVGPARAAKPYDLDSDTAVRTPADLDALGPTEKADTVTASVACRDIKTTARGSDGQTSSNLQTACKSPDGTWQLD